MAMFQLVTRHLYFGVDAMQLQIAAGRVLMRVVGRPPERATVGLDTLAQDFGMNTRESLALVDQMVLAGLLQKPHPSEAEYVITDKFRQYAQARIVDPLPRARAQLLLTHMAERAQYFNRTASRNKYEIEALAVHGSYMSREPEIPDLMIGVTGRRRGTVDRHVAGRATVPTNGRQQIRELFEELSSFVWVTFFHRLQEVPRPFTVIFKDDA
jgi:hypothetical protein